MTTTAGAVRIAWVRCTVCCGVTAAVRATDPLGPSLELGAGHVRAAHPDVGLPGVLEIGSGPAWLHDMSPNDSRWLAEFNRRYPPELTAVGWSVS